MALKSRSSVVRAQIEALKAELRIRPGQCLSASELSQLTGAPKSWVRRFLEGQGEVKISDGPPYKYSWEGDPKVGRQ